jgi:hypothetical protein
MKKIIAILLTVITTLTVAAQNFEGEIKYTNIYKSKKWFVSDEKLNSLMGTKEEYFIKGGDYKAIANGTWVQWTQYINKDNKIYTKLYDNETVYWNDANSHDDLVLKVELNQNTIEILGYKCDEVILTCKSGIQKYYFNSKISVDSKFFVNHTFGNWYNYLKIANALPLKMVIDNEKCSMESIATEVKEMKLDAKVFELPANCKTKKNPY